MSRCPSPPICRLVGSQYMLLISLDFKECPIKGLYLGTVKELRRSGRQCCVAVTAWTGGDIVFFRLAAGYFLMYVLMLR
jgi:hypothetical protein